MRRPIALAALLLLITALPALADEIHLKNGDRITGQFISMSADVVSWKGAAGDLKINWADVVSLDIDNPVYVVVADNPPLLTGVSPGDAPGRAELMPGGPVNLSDIVSITYGKRGGGGGAAAATPNLITGGAGAGVIATSGNTKLNSLRLNGDVDARMSANRYVASAIVTHSKDNGIETARNWSLSGRYDRYLLSWLYAEANAVLVNDRFRDIDLRSAYGAGVGVQLLNTPRIKVSGAGGIGEVRNNFRSIADFNYTAAFESGSVKIELLPDHVELFHTDDGYFQVSKGDQMFVRTQSGLHLGLGAGFAATLEYDWDFDRHPSPGRNTVDMQTAFTLGYRF